MSIFTPLDDNLEEYGDIVSVEFFKGLTDNLNYLLDSAPVGEISAFLILTGINEPDPRFWQECDGSDVLDQTSPLRGYPTPDMTQTGGLYLKGTDLLASAGQVAGSHEKNLAHDHSGLTQNHHVDNNADTDDDRWSGHNDHAHHMPSDLNTPIDFQPEHGRFRHYIKIN